MSVRNVLGIAAAGLLLLISVPLESIAQVTASIGGIVSDATGALIPGAEVTAENVNTGISTTQVTNEAGAYNVPSLQPGTYRVSAALPGFQTATRENIQLSQGQQVRFNFALQVGALATEVEVVADSATALATTSATIGDVLPDIQVRSLPLASRNVIDLATLSAGIVGDNFGGTRASQINTTRDGLPTGDGRYLDWNGAYSGTFTSPDLVEEVQVNVSSVDSSVGRGSGQVRLQTRSGTNEFHGALFYTNENSALSSNNWFTNLVGAEKTYSNRNQFGGRFGGPIVRDKAFFFVLLDQQRYLDKEDVVGRVLTAEARQGIFRYLTADAPGDAGGTNRRNGNANATTPSVDLNGSILTSDGGTPLFLNSFNLFTDVNDPNRTRIDPIWMGPEYLSRMPLPNDWTEGDGLNTAGIRWQRRQEGVGSATGNSQTENRDHLTVRVDYQLDDGNRVSFSTTREENWSVTGQTGLPDWPTGTFGRLRRTPDFYTASWTSIVTPTVVNEFRWGKKADSWIGEQPFLWGCCEAGSLFFDAGNLEPEAQEWAGTFPSINVPQVGNFSGGDVTFLLLQDTNVGGDYARVRQDPRFSRSPLWQWADTLSWTRGAHSFQFGFDATWASTSQVDSIDSFPTATLGVGDVPVPGINSTNFSGLNNNDVGLAEDILANLAGSIDGLQQTFYILELSQTEFLGFTDGALLKDRAFHQNDYAGFFKDTWNVTPNLTLNWGVRFDIYGTPYEGNGLGVKPIGGEAALYGISRGSPTVFDLAGKKSPNPETLIHNNDLNNFAPSFGFSYNVPWLSRTTVVRGGYGINYVGSATFLQYSGSIGGAPGSTLAISRSPGELVPSGYLDIGSALTQFPLPTGGVVPREPIPLTNRSTSIQGYADDRVVPYIQNWNLSVQRELARNLTLDVSYVGSKGTKLRSARNLNYMQIFDNGLLEAFNITREGGDAPLFDQMLDGIGIGSITVGTNGSGSEALRRFGTTDNYFANGEVGNLANFLNDTSTGTGENGGLLRTNGFPENFIITNPQFGNVTLHGNDDNSTYHSLQTSLTRRLAQGFTAEINYTWSRAIGNSAAGNSNASDTTASVRDPLNRQLQKGLVTFHRTHSLKWHGTWQLPFGPGRALLSNAPSWVDRIVEGWDISGIFSWTSGQPLDITTTRRTLDSASNINTPDLVGDLPSGKVQVGDGVVDYFAGLRSVRGPSPDFGADPNNLAADFTNNIVVDGSGNTIFQNPGPGTTGNLGLSLSRVEGPGDVGFDVALQKSIQFSESRTFSLRADALNILNAPQWNNPNTDINSASFGRITSASGERSIVVNARIDF